MYLLDTNIVSELRKPKPHASVIHWLNAVDEAALYLSAVTLGEIQAGIELTRDQDKIKADEIEIWLNHLSHTYQILPMDTVIFRQWAKLMHKQSNTVSEDAMIAATALVHRLTVVTRNISDFERFPVNTFNPFY